MLAFDVMRVTKCSKGHDDIHWQQYRRKKDGYTYFRCAECMRETTRRFRAKNPDYMRQHNMLHKYGVTPRRYAKLLAAQGGRCAVCREKKFLVIDHCHVSQAVRGLLCDNCNRGLGSFHDNPDFLRGAITYLSRTSSSSSRGVPRRLVLRRSRSEQGVGG